MIPSIHPRNKLLAVLMTAAIAAIIACGQESSSSDTSSTTIDEPPALETQQEVVEVAESVPDLPSAPDFTLPAANKNNTEISLSSFQGDKPVVLVFYRAYW